MWAVTLHFKERVAQRVSPEACPVEIARGIYEAVQQGRTDLVRFVGRSKQGLRGFMFRWKDGREFVAIVDTDDWNFVTVVTEEWNDRRVEAYEARRAYRNRRRDGRRREIRLREGAPGR